MHTAAGMRNRNHLGLAGRRPFHFVHHLSQIQLRHDERFHPLGQLADALLREGPDLNQPELARANAALTRQVIPYDTTTKSASSSPPVSASARPSASGFNLSWRRRTRRSCTSTFMLG